LATVLLKLSFYIGRCGTTGIIPTDDGVRDIVLID
jgi:hypothetical protein